MNWTKVTAWTSLLLCEYFIIAYVTMIMAVPGHFSVTFLYILFLGRGF